MISLEMHNDLISFEKPILYIGDSFQLPPVNDDFNIMSDEFVDGRLTEIHRQAENNPIIKLSVDIREGRRIDYHKGEFTSKIHKEEADDDMFVNSHQIITGKNSTRVMLNQKVRKLLGFNSPLPQRDDRLIFLQNNYKCGVLNGQQVIALSHCIKSKKDAFRLDFIDYTHDITKLLDLDTVSLEVWTGAFNNEDYDYHSVSKDYAVADFAYGITVYKSQGSSWPNVLIYDDHFGVWDQKLRMRWLYTGITRASKSVLIIS